MRFVQLFIAISHFRSKLLKSSRYVGRGQCYRVIVEDSFSLRLIFHIKLLCLKSLCFMFDAFILTNSHRCAIFPRGRVNGASSVKLGLTISGNIILILFNIIFVIVWCNFHELCYWKLNNVSNCWEFFRYVFYKFVDERQFKDL